MRTEAAPDTDTTGHRCLGQRHVGSRRRRCRHVRHGTDRVRRHDRRGYRGRGRAADGRWLPGRWRHDGRRRAARYRHHRRRCRHGHDRERRCGHGTGPGHGVGHRDRYGPRDRPRDRPGPTPGSGTGAGTGTDTGTDTGGTASGGDAEPPAQGGSTDGSTSGAPTTAGGPTEAIDLDDYEIAFNDEFDGTALDPTKWKTAFEYGNAAVEQERQYYVDSLDSDAGLGYDPFTVAGGTLTIRAIETPDEMRADVSGRDWLSGVISTAGGRFEFDSGYAEIRVDLPEGAGLGSMFTLIASDYSAPPRPMVVAMRHDGDAADELMHDYQFTDDGGTRRTPGAWTVSDDSLPDGFHTVGVSWDAEGLVFFVDGEATYRIIGDDVPAQPLYLVANLAIGGASRSEPDDATPSPAALVIDHVRVWRKRP